MGYGIGTMTMDLSLARIAALLRERPSSASPSSTVDGRAAVALVLRFEADAPSVLLMTRAERAGDRWSGQVSFPGGREEEGDEDLLTTAMRETREEVGLDLESGARLLGRLGTIQARARGRLLPLTIDPFVFLQTQDDPLALGEEAVETFWFPLTNAAAGEYSSTFELAAGECKRTLPCWRFESRIIWGLTYEMLHGFLALAGGTNGSEDHA